MSAFVVVKEHIDAMVALGLDGPSDRQRHLGDGITMRWAVAEVDDWRDLEWREVNHLTASETGEMLVLECVRSVSLRYPDSGDLPGPLASYWTDYYEFRRPTRMPTGVQGLKLLDCYEYQSCEHPDWMSSEARRFCEALRSRLITSLPGYSEAPWEWLGSPAAA